MSMQRTVQRPTSRIVEAIPAGARVCVIGCGDCATVEHFGGEAECIELAEALREQGVEVSGWACPPEGDGVCNLTVARRLQSAGAEVLERSDVIVLLACPQGEPAVARATGLPVIMATQVIVGGLTGGNQVAVEDCHFCEVCIARAAGGLCPHSFCPKQMVNGPCGGAQGGRCEVLPKRPCGCEQIHRRLKASGRLDVLAVYQAPISFAPTSGEDAED